MSAPVLRIGTRTSTLAMWQTQRICVLLRQAVPAVRCEIVSFVTQGDRNLDRPLPTIGGKGLFTAELEQALRSRAIDLAVHSLKDLPTDNPPELTVGAIVDRGSVHDGLVARSGWTLATLPAGAVVGTSSTRRQAQLLAVRPDLRVTSIRGNVPTRVQKVLDGRYDAAVLAAAGLERLGLGQVVTEWLSLDIMLPAPGQGALAVQCRADDHATLAVLAAIDDAPTRAAVTAERTFLRELGGGCAAPIAAYAAPGPASLHLRGLVATIDGAHVVRVAGEGQDAVQLGASLAQEALERGAREILSHVGTVGR